MTVSSVGVPAPELSIIVVTFEMRREAPRTLRSLSPGYQRGVDPAAYEVIVVDNGSAEPLSAAEVEGSGPNVRYRMLPPGNPSPAAAVNAGLAMARGRFVGVLLDGARMLTPGVVGLALRALRLHDRAVVATLAWHLGPDHQSRSAAQGYDRVVEDGLLDSIGWPADGYRLFEIAALAGSNAGGWFLPLAESCCLFLPRALADELGGWDEAFDLPGGGLVNLDAFVRACDLPGTELVVLLGEGSFHQIHGGVTTAAGTALPAAFHEQYLRLRDRPFTPPAKPALYLGPVPAAALPFLEASAQVAREVARRAGTGSVVGGGPVVE